MIAFRNPFWNLWGKKHSVSVRGDVCAVAFPGVCVLTVDDVMRAGTFPQVDGCNLLSVGKKTDSVHADSVLLSAVRNSYR